MAALPGFRVAAALVLSAVMTGAVSALPEEGDPYVVGGPLAGLKLPLFRTQHGEPPGFPGCLPGKDEKGNTLYPVQGNPALFELYPGSVELWRQLLHRYVPARPFYDKQSQLQNWVAPDIPGARPDQVEQYAAPLYWVGSHTQLKFTGKYLAPVPVVRCRPRAPVFDLDLGELPYGLYVVRLIGAVPTKELRVVRKPIFVRMRVNDRVDGGESEYRLRIGYVDEFYSVAEIYFHAPATRRYRAKVWVDEGSRTDLLVHNISLDDVLAGCTRRALKKRAVWPDRKRRKLHPDFARRWKLDDTPEERWRRDRDIWFAFPPTNCHPRHDDFSSYAKRSVRTGVAGKDRAAIEKEHGAWTMPRFTLAPFVYAANDGVGTLIRLEEEATHVLLKNEKLGLTYTVDDWYAQRPLPAPYPYRDDGCGLVTPDPRNPNIAWLWCPIAEAVNRRYYDYFRVVIHGAKTNHPALARDRAVALIRLAYEWPTMDNANSLLSLVHVQNGQYDTRCRRRNTQSRLPWTHVHIQLVKAYDALYETIKGDEDLAKSVSRFVPWVQSSEDLIRLLDVYLLQTQAKRLLRYHYYRDGHPALIADTATILGDRSVTDPWMEWLFSRTWMYPLRASGLQDYLISNNDRAGISYIGSTSYGLGAASWKTARILEDYIRNGGNPKFDLRNPRLYPKPVASLYFPLRERTAAIHWPRIGDVTGPDKPARLGAPDGALGWRWTRDPVFAYLIRHYGKKDRYTAEEWKEIERAAAAVRRPPWLDNRSRFLPNWAAFLEAGVEHDDFRFRRSVMLRLGRGMGHSHNDAFDLQIMAHGIPMVVDAGQRGGYSKPGDSLRIVHNSVAVRGDARHGGGMWLEGLTDAEGARYLCARTAPPGLYRRQVALLDVSPGSGAKPLTPAQCVDYARGLPKDVVTPNSYVFDVFRVGGLKGKTSHLYCFHGPANDPPASGGPGIKVNLRPEGLTAELRRAAQAFLAPFAGEKLVGTAPEVLEVTFQVQKKRFLKGKIPAGTERVYLRQAYDPDAPTKYLRWHLLNAAGALVMKGDLHCTKWRYFLPNVFVQRTGEDLESAFAAVIEPYAGKPFLASVRALPVAGNETDAARAVAVEVRTPDGHTDLCFADGRPERTRRIATRAGSVRAAAEFAYLSRDAEGIRQVALSGGTRIEAADVALRCAAPERRAKVVRVDYLAKTLWVDQAWPALGAGRVFEIGTLPPEAGGAGPGYVTTFTAVAFRPEGGRTAITTLGGADLYRARIVSVDEKAGIVRTAIRKPVGAFGFESRFVASNEQMSKFWRAEMHEGERRAASHPIKLTGAPVSAKDFEPAGALRLWEYGVGDTVRMVTYASLRRVAPGTFALEADVDVTLRLKGRRMSLSADGRAWKALATRRAAGRSEATIPLASLRAGRSFVRVEQPVRGREENPCRSVSIPSVSP